MAVKLPFWATLLTLIGLTILCTMGTWQLQRLEWKTALLAQIENQRSADEIETLSAANITIINEYKTGKFRGRFLSDKDTPISLRTFEGTPGTHIITPFRLDDGKIVLINRGWVEHDQPWQAPSKTGEVVGMIRTPPASNIFTPPNDPANNQWFSINIDEIAAHHRLKNVHPVMIYAASTPSEITAYPLASALTIKLNNNHLGYAVFWFSLAGTLLIIYTLRFAVLRKL